MRLIPLLSVLLAITGCSDALHFSQPPSPFNQPTSAYAMAPKQLYETAKRVVTSAPLSIPIQQEQNGILITEWKEYPGDWHIARRWQERTRYRIAVIPDFDNPTGRARLEVAEETQTRAADGQTWRALPEVT